MRALEQFQHVLVSHKITIYVRRGGPNYQEGLRLMRTVGEWAFRLHCFVLHQRSSRSGTTLGVPIHVYGPETHMTAIVSMALGLKETLPSPVEGAG